MTQGAKTFKKEDLVDIASRFADQFEHSLRNVSREELLSTINEERFAFLMTLPPQDLIDMEAEAQNERNVEDGYQGNRLIMTASEREQFK